MAVETDVLEIVVLFVKNTEFVDQDVSRYLEEIEDVNLELNALRSNPGTHTVKMMTRLLDQDLKEWHNPELGPTDLRALHDESIDVYLQLWQERFPRDAGNLKMFLFFSMRRFRREVVTIEEAQRFGEEYEDMLGEYYCETVSFEARYEEAKGEIFTAEAIGTKSEFRKQCRQYKRYIFRNYLTKNKVTGEDWTTKDVLLDLLSTKNTEVLDWLPPSSVLHYVMKCCLVQVTSSADVERVMSVFTLFDNKLNQGTEPDTVEKTVILMKEIPSWQYFDTEAAAVMWAMQPKEPKGRKLALPRFPSSQLQESSGKCWVKTLELIHEASIKRKKKLLKMIESCKDVEGDLESDNKNAAEEDGYESDEIGAIHIDAESSDEDDEENESEKVINNQDGDEFSEVEVENEKAKEEDEFGSNTSGADNKGEEGKDDDMVSAPEEKGVESRKQEETQGKEEMRKQDEKEKRKEIKEEAKKQKEKKV